MKLEVLVLGVLLERPQTGYDLKKYFDSTGRFLRSKTQMSQVYRSLGAMEERGWVTHSVERRPGAQDAKTFRVTEAGVTVFLDWLDAPYSPPARFQDPDFTALLSFGGFMLRDRVVRLIDTEVRARREQIEEYRQQGARRPTGAEVPFDTALADLLHGWGHDYGVAAVHAHLAMLERLRDDVLALPPRS